MIINYLVVLSGLYTRFFGCCWFGDSVEVSKLTSDFLRRDFDRPNTFAVRFSLVQVGSLWLHARSKSRSVRFEP